ncbi:MFS transporter [Endozoicomonas sp. G2_1]|uniref:MFS transporter n=1 Tax=Endozoicomonas sp. G2_1 TaxID=2821091 RepID=UPI001ADAE144|nr:MFS transporter [Endozoicomonas sp. G2_1]MBO9491533.1 MFS transporter [Endozoicomonas sp. G2_1]
MSASGLNKVEKKAAFSLAAVFGLRMLGLFMILPVFALYGQELIGYSPLWLGLAIGAYGLTQALLQIPMGILSDKFGRKPVILAGLLVFLLGSVVAAMSDTVYGVVFGRALQGMGAIASAVLALAADLSREEQRSKVMATIGMFIGLSFTAAMIIGPVVAEGFGLSGLFWFTAILTVLAMAMIQFVVPFSVNKSPRGDNVALPEKLGQLFKAPQLARLNFGVFVLHMVLTACFVSLPKLFVSAGLPLANHWQLYLPVLLGAFVLMVPLMIYGLKKQKEKQVFILSISLMIIAMLLLFTASHSLTMLVVCLLLFFVAFNYLEASMPSILSRLAPAGVKGSAMGIYSSSQFFGAFLGGAIGGLIASIWSEQAIYLVMASVLAVWLLWSLTMAPLVKSKSYSLAVNTSNEQQTQTLASQISELPGVLEATLVHEEAVAYLKIDEQQADLAQIKALLQA